LGNEEVFENIVSWLSEHKVFVPRSALDNLKLNEIEEIDSLILISLILEIEILKTRKFNLDNMVEINNYTLQELIQSI
jgi:hypothetical protein